MAQGALKLKSKQKSHGSSKRKVLKVARKVTKGRKQHNAKGSKAVTEKATTELSKEISKKNEALIAAKAVSAGTKFFLTDVSSRGEKEHAKHISERNKKQDKGKRMTERLKSQLQKLQTGEP